MSSIDLVGQVHGELRRFNGGTGTKFGAGTQMLLVPWTNDSGAAWPIGSLVTRTSSSALASSPGAPFIGVVAGRYSPTTQQFEEVACGANEQAAVAVAGIVNVLTTSAALRGQYLRPSTTAGQAEPTDAPQTGTFAWVLLALSSTMAQAVFMAGGQGVAGGYYDINVLFNGSGTQPVLGVVGYVNISAPGTIVGVRMIADQVGSAVVGIKKASSLAGVPGSSIVSGAPPTLASARTAQGSISGWTTSIALGDVLEFSLTSISLITALTCALQVRRS